MKAVIWTDVFQGGVMYLGLIVILIKVGLELRMCSGILFLEFRSNRCSPVINILIQYIYSEYVFSLGRLYRYTMLVCNGNLGLYSFKKWYNFSSVARLNVIGSMLHCNFKLCKLVNKCYITLHYITYFEYTFSGVARLRFNYCAIQSPENHLLILFQWAVSSLGTLAL